MSKSVKWSCVVTTADGSFVPFDDTCNWRGLTDSDVTIMEEKSTEAVMGAKGLEKKGGDYIVTFSGGITDSETGVFTPDSDVTVQLDADGVGKYVQRYGKSLVNFLIDWLTDDVQHGKTGWGPDGKPPKPDKPGKPEPK